MPPTYTHDAYRIGFTVNKPKPLTDAQVCLKLNWWGRVQWRCLASRRPRLRQRVEPDIDKLAEALGRATAQTLG